MDIFFSFSVLLIADHRVWTFEMSAPLSEGGYEAEAYCGEDAPNDSSQFNKLVVVIKIFNS